MKVKGWSNRIKSANWGIESRNKLILWTRNNSRKVLEFVKILMFYRSNTIYELNMIKDSQDELCKKISRIERIIKEKSYLPPHDLLSEFAQ